MISIVLKSHIHRAQRFELQVRHLEWLLHGCVHPELIRFTFSVWRRDRRVVGDLLRDVLPSIPNHFEGLAKDGIERLCRSVFSPTVLSHAEGSHIGHSHDGVLSLPCFLKQVFTVHKLSYFLKHWNRLIEVDWNAELWEIFANHVFKDLPYTDVSSLFKSRKAISWSHVALEVLWVYFLTFIFFFFIILIFFNWLQFYSRWEVVRCLLEVLGLRTLERESFLSFLFWDLFLEMFNDQLINLLIVLSVVIIIWIFWVKWIIWMKDWLSHHDSCHPCRICD